MMTSDIPLKNVLRRVNELSKQQEDNENAYVCCSKDLPMAKARVMDLSGPNAVYCKDDHCVYFHSKTIESRVRHARRLPNPHGNSAIEVLRAVMQARKHNPGVKPTMIKL